MLIVALLRLEPTLAMVYTAYLIITPDPGQDHYIQEVSYESAPECLY